MAYLIRYFQNSRPTGDEHWTGIFGEAKALAGNAVKTGAAQRVEILDEDGQIVFHYPRISEAS
jgi:hypothetical protein